MFQGRKKSGIVHIRLQKTKEKLLEELSKTVKELQKHVLFNSGSFEISKNDESALHLTFILEAIFLHGHQASISVFGKSSSSGILPSPDFWDILHPFTHRDVLHQLSHLSHVNTLVGKCRAWIRLALNDGLIESYLHAILSDKKKLSRHYSPKSFLRDEEATSIILNHFLGLIELTFDLNYNTPSLNQWTVTALQLSATWEPHSGPIATVAKPAEFPNPLSIPKAAIQVKTSHKSGSSPSSSCSPREKRKNRKHTHEPRDVAIKTETSEDKNSSDVHVDKSNIPVGAGVHETVNNRKNDSEQASDTRGEDNDQGAHISPAMEAVQTPSPVNIRGGNMLGMASGWSSSFEPEPTIQKPVDNFEKPSVVSEVQPNKAVTSFHGILCDYPVTGSKKFVSNEFAAQLSSPPDEAVFNEVIESSSKGTFTMDQTDFEIVGHHSTPEESYLHEKYMAFLASVNDIPREMGLDGQNYKCEGCSRPVGMIYGQYKVCSYDGSYYCYECHVDDEHVIPARIIHNWDLNKYKVAKHTKLFLMQIDEEPLFHIDEVNPTLYNVISDINKTKQLRIQLQHLKGYVSTCGNTMVAEDVKRRMWPREYLWDDIHQYSLLDLIQVNSGQLQHHLRKIISFCKKHVYGCEVCSQKGFICEICKNPKIVYAFEVNSTAQCPRCKAVFHKQCKVEGRCPRCIRRLSRKQVTPGTKERSENRLNSLF